MVVKENPKNQRGFTSGQKRILLTLVLLALGLSLLSFVHACPLLIVALMRQTGASTDAAFCTKNDAIYQAINSNLELWLNYFPSENTSWSGTQKFSVAGGKQYVVETPLTYTKGERVLFIPVDRGIGPGIPREGVRGYIYTQNGLLPSLPGYESLRLDNHVFCYWLENVEPPVVM
jgi:hypothetical protein